MEQFVTSSEYQFDNDSIRSFSFSSSSSPPTPAVRSSSRTRAELALLALMFSVMLVGNSSVIASLALRRKKLTRMYFFILHVCIADLIVAFLQTLPQFCWTVVGHFRGNDFLCKSVKMGQMLGPYSSSYVLVAMAVDRYLAICFPLNSWAATRSKAMVAVAWAIAVACSIPQAILFNYEYVPQQRTWDCWVNFTPSEARAYVTWYAVANTFIPLLVLLFTYSAICRAVWRNFRHKKAGESTPKARTLLQLPPSDQRNGSCRSIRSGRIEALNPRTHSMQRISRAKIKTVKLTVVVITCYIVCCMPFTCAMLWTVYDANATQTAFYKGWLFSVLTLIASLNSCVNPWVFLGFNRNLAAILYHSLRRCCFCCAQPQIDTRPIPNVYSRTSISDTIAIQRFQLHPTLSASNIASPAEERADLVVFSRQHNDKNNCQQQTLTAENANDCACEPV